MSFLGLLPNVTSAFATDTAFYFFTRGEEAVLVLLNLLNIRCDLWSLQKLQRQMLWEVMRALTRSRELRIPLRIKGSEKKDRSWCTGHPETGNAIDNLGVVSPPCYESYHDTVQN
jgi:hypothetical protein